MLIHKKNVFIGDGLNWRGHYSHVPRLNAISTKRNQQINTNHNVSPCRAVCCRWARAGPSTLRSTRCTPVCRGRRRSAAGRGTPRLRRLARLLLLQQLRHIQKDCYS